MRLKKKFMGKFIAIIAVCVMAIMPFISKGQKASADEKNISNNSLKKKIVKDKVYGTSSNNSITSVEKISYDTLKEQLKNSSKTKLAKIKNSSEMLEYLKDRKKYDQSKESEVVSSVDNSQEKYFPTIKSQGGISSCVGWATAYYQFSYTVNKELDRDGKIEENTYSPMWLFNMINNGMNSGSRCTDGLIVLSEIGALPWTYIEGKGNATSITDVHAKKENFLEASKYKISEFYNIDINNEEVDTFVTNNKDEDLEAIKSALAAGEVLTASTDSEKWVRQSIVVNEQVEENNNYLGEKIITMCNDEKTGNHRITIVGYNDDLWVDINENDIVEEGEMGALKLANSWGTDSDNDGFVWMSYDALNKVSSVTNQESMNLNGKGRESGLYSIIGFDVDLDSSDSDCFLALNLETDNAAQVHVNIIAKDKNTGTEICNYNPVPFNNSETASHMGECGFNGKNNSDKTGEFYIDLGNAIEGITKDTIDNYDLEITIADTEDNDSSLNVNSAKIYILSDDLYKDTALVNQVALNKQNLKIYYGNMMKTEISEWITESNTRR